jgi:TusA-related sulfurtransferase
MRVLGALLFALAACGGASRNETAVRQPTGLMERGMMNCPSAVAGARTAATDVDGGIALTITADDPKAAQEIRDASAVQAKMGVPSDEEHELHTGEHGGPGTTGHCPVIHIDTMITITNVDGGARITILSANPGQTEALRRDVRRRVDALARVQP